MKRRSLQPDWRVPSSWPSPRSSRSTSASSKPSVVSTSACSRDCGDVGQLELVARDEQAVALLRAAADAAAQLVQLRETEPVGLLHDHDRRVRHVDADLDHRRRHEHVELACLELRHHLAPLRRLQPPVQEPDAVALQLGAAQPLRLLLGGARESRLGLLDQRADDIRLPAGVEVHAQPRVRLATSARHPPTP